LVTGNIASVKSLHVYELFLQCYKISIENRATLVCTYGCLFFVFGLDILYCDKISLVYEISCHMACLE